MAEQKIGTVIHYWSKIGVAGLRITDGELRVGDTIHIKGHTSDFTQRVDSIQIENQSVEAAQPGGDVGVKVVEHVRHFPAAVRQKLPTPRHQAAEFVESVLWRQPHAVQKSGEAGVRSDGVQPWISSQKVV